MPQVRRKQLHSSSLLKYVLTDAMLIYVRMFVLFVAKYVLSLDYPQSGTIRSLCWSDCGTELAAACSNGCLLVAHLVDRVLEWNNFEVFIRHTDIVMKKRSLILSFLFGDYLVFV